MKKIPYRFRLYFLPSGNITFETAPYPSENITPSYSDHEKHFGPERLATITRTLTQDYGQPEVHTSSNNVFTLTWEGQATSEEAENV